MAERWNSFMNRATVVALKGILSELNLPTSGNKPALKVRLQDAVADFSDERLMELIPVDEGQEDDLEVGDNSSSDESEGHEDGEENQDENDEEGTNSESNDVENVDSELQRLRKLLKKQKEISRLKKEIKKLQLEDKEVTSRSSVHHFKDIEDSLPAFNGDDNYPVQRWIEQYEELAETFNLDDKSKFIYAKRCLSGTAKLFIRTTVIKSWKEMKKLLLEEFSKNVTKADIHNELRKRQKKKEETMQQYVFHMQEIASTGLIDEQDLIQYIINGIPDSEINKIILYNANNISE